MQISLHMKAVKRRGVGGGGEEENTQPWAVNRGNVGCGVFLVVFGGLLNALGRHVIPTELPIFFLPNAATTNCF